MGIFVRHGYWWFNPWSRLLFAAKLLDGFAIKKLICLQCAVMFIQQFKFKKFFYDKIMKWFPIWSHGWCHDYRRNHRRPYQCQSKTWARDGFRRLWISILPLESLLLLEFYIDRINKIHSTVWLKKVNNSFSELSIFLLQALT